VAEGEEPGSRILDGVEMLESHPYLGEPGRSPDTRELGVPDFPYLIVYSVDPTAGTSGLQRVAILRVLHGAMIWPPAAWQ